MTFAELTTSLQLSSTVCESTVKKVFSSFNLGSPTPIDCPELLSLIMRYRLFNKLYIYSRYLAHKRLPVEYELVMLKNIEDSAAWGYYNTFLKGERWESLERYYEGNWSISYTCCLYANKVHDMLVKEYRETGVLPDVVQELLDTGKVHSYILPNTYVNLLIEAGITGDFPQLSMAISAWTRNVRETWTKRKLRDVLVNYYVFVSQRPCLNERDLIVISSSLKAYLYYCKLIGKGNKWPLMEELYGTMFAIAPSADPLCSMLTRYTRDVITASQRTAESVRKMDI